MTYIFPSQVGIPAVATDPNAYPTTFSAALGGWGSLNAMHCIIAGIGGRTQGNYQFLSTLRNFTYVYVFGEKMGDFQISGLSLAGLCGDARDGMSSAIGYYNTYAISVTGLPVVVQMAGWAAYAFLISGDFAYTDPENRIGKFTYYFKTATQ